MNRFKKEENIKNKKVRDGLTNNEIEKLDLEEALKSKINKIANEIHTERFPEEYDHMYDSISDANDRNRGINPMSSEYIARVAAKRAEAGVSPLNESGMPVCGDSWEFAYEVAEMRVRGS